MKSLVCRIGLMGCVTLPAACAGGFDEEGEALGVMSEAISGGTLVTSGENTTNPAANALPFASVVKITSSVGGCTAVKIGSNRFLSAAHCFSEGETSITMTNGLEGAGAPFTVTKLFIHPSYRIGGTPDAFIDPGLSELAVFEVAQNTPTVLVAPLDGRFIDTSTTAGATLVAYGCDNQGSSNEGKKQKGIFNILTGGPPAVTEVHYLREGSPPNSCDGDSGGPLFFLSNNRWRVGGIVAGRPNFTRVSNTIHWINAPQAPAFVAEEPGYFMNRKAAFESENTLNCLSADPPPSTSPPADPKIPVLLHYCDKPEGSRLNSNKIPYWVLRASTIAGHFNIVNFSGRCLEAEVGGTDAITRRCVASSANQAWRFEDLGLAGPAPTTGVPAPRIHRIRANAGGRCLGTLNGSTTSNSDVRMFTCDSSKEDQEWVFFH